jgi:hypothetical protein
MTVKSAFSFLVSGSTTGNLGISIAAANTGSVTVTLTGCQLRIKGRDETLAPVEWVMQTLASLPTTVSAEEPRPPPVVNPYACLRSLPGRADLISTC